MRKQTITKTHKSTFLFLYTFTALKSCICTTTDRNTPWMNASQETKKSWLPCGFFIRGRLVTGWQKDHRSYLTCFFFRFPQTSSLMLKNTYSKLQWSFQENCKLHATKCYCSLTQIYPYNVPLLILRSEHQQYTLEQHFNRNANFRYITIYSSVPEIRFFNFPLIQNNPAANSNNGPISLTKQEVSLQTKIQANYEKQS